MATRTLLALLAAVSALGIGACATSGTPSPAVSVTGHVYSVDGDHIPSFDTHTREEAGTSRDPLPEATVEIGTCEGSWTAVTDEAGAFEVAVDRLPTGRDCDYVLVYGPGHHGIRMEAVRLETGSSGRAQLIAELPTSACAKPEAVRDLD